MGIELEYKYRVPDAETLERVLAAAPDHARTLGAVERVEMRTTYFDSLSGAFSARRWTLRLRTENGAPVVTLKTPRPDGAAGEWESPCESVEAAVPALLAQGAPEQLAEFVREGLREVCTAAFVRRAQLLKLPDGSLCELAADLGELCGRTQREKLCELELELKRGAPEQTRRLGERLCAEFGLRIEKLSKFARARALK